MNGKLQILSAAEEQGALFRFSELMFRIGLTFITFEQIRPFGGIQLSDYCFFLSLFLFLSRPKSRIAAAVGSGVVLPGSLILLGGLLSLRNASSINDASSALLKLFVLFGLFALLAVIHSREIRKNMLCLLLGICVNCGITLVQAWIFPGIVKLLSINPGSPDLSDIGRFQGMTSHPNTLGLAAALGVLIGFGLICFEKNRSIRWKLVAVITICYIAALLSGSRTVLASLVPGIIVFAILEKQNRKAIIRAFVGLVVVGGVVAYVASSLVLDYSERLGMSGAEYDSDYTRVISAALTAQEISQKPILGWGADYFGESAEILTLPNGDSLGTEFTFLRYWYAAGLLAAIGFLMLFIVPTRNIVRVLKETPSRDVRNVLTVALSCYLLLFIASSLHPFLFNRYLYITLFVFAGFVSRLRGSSETYMTSAAAA